MHFNLDNKEYSLTLENREKKTKKQKSGLRYALPATALFATQLDYLRVLVCWSEATSYRFMFSPYDRQYIKFYDTIILN